MDRKAWIILTICGILLALNFYYKPEPPQRQLRSAPNQKTRGQAPQLTATKVLLGWSQQQRPQGELFNEPPVPAVGENIETLTSKNKDGEDVVEFAISSSGGGIKTATLLGQYAVGSDTEKVVLNMHSPATIGSICEGPDDFTDLYYDLVKERGRDLLSSNHPRGS